MIPGQQACFGALFMVMAIVKFMSIARMRAGTGSVEFKSSRSRLRDVLREIVDRCGMSEIFLTQSGEVRAWATSRTKELCLETLLPA